MYINYNKKYLNYFVWIWFAILYIIIITSMVITYLLIYYYEDYLIVETSNIASALTDISLQDVNSLILFSRLYENNKKTEVIDASKLNSYVNTSNFFKKLYVNNDINEFDPNYFGSNAFYRIKNILSSSLDLNFKQELIEKTFKESIAKMSGKNNHMFGKSIPDDTISKMSEAKAGKNNPMFGRIGENNPVKRYMHMIRIISRLYLMNLIVIQRLLNFLIVIEKLFIILLIKINITKINGFYLLISYNLLVNLFYYS
jgi:hypothetical protein